MRQQLASDQQSGPSAASDVWKRQTLGEKLEAPHSPPLSRLDFLPATQVEQTFFCPPRSGPDFLHATQVGRTLSAHHLLLRGPNFLPATQVRQTFPCSLGDPIAPLGAPRQFNLTWSHSILSRMGAARSRSRWLPRSVSCLLWVPWKRGCSCHLAKMRGCSIFFLPWSVSCLLPHRSH